MLWTVNQAENRPGQPLAVFTTGQTKEWSVVAITTSGKGGTGEHTSLAESKGHSGPG